MDKSHPQTRDKPLAWCLSEIQATYARLYPALRWENMPGGISGVSSLITTELEARRTSLALSLIRMENLPELAREGWIRPLDAWFTPEQLAIYAPEALALATVNGRLYAIPDDITPFVFFVRADLLKRLKMDPPRTWDEFEALIAALAKRRQPLTMVAGGQRFRLGFMLALLGSNGVVPTDSERMLADARRVIEAYDWLKRLAVERRLVPVDEIAHPRSLPLTEARRVIAGFGWLSEFYDLPAAMLRNLIFLPFPRGPSLPPGAAPHAPLKGSGWCMPWSRVPPDEVLAVLRTLHSPATRRAVGNSEAFPYTAVRARWDDPAVRRRFPLYNHASRLIDGVVAIPAVGPAHFRRLDITFRNALLDGLDGQEWLNDFSGRDTQGSARGDSPPIRLILSTIEAHLGKAGGIGDVARSLGLHPVRLRRLLRRELNEEAGRYFRKRRLELARELLVAGGMSVKQVAGRVGYRDACAFTRAYRLHYGHAPTAATTATKAHASAGGS